MPMPPGGLARCGALNRETRRGRGIGEPLVRGPSRSPAPERGKGGEAFASHGKSECPCLDMVRTVAPLLDSYHELRIATDPRMGPWRNALAQRFQLSTQSPRRALPWTRRASGGTPPCPRHGVSFGVARQTCIRGLFWNRHFLRPLTPAARLRCLGCPGGRRLTDFLAWSFPRSL